MTKRMSCSISNMRLPGGALHPDNAGDAVAHHRMHPRQRLVQQQQIRRDQQLHRQFEQPLLPD